MKVSTEVTVSRCEAGNCDLRISVEIEANTGGYGKADPIVGTLEKTLDGARKAAVASLEASKP